MIKVAISILLFLSVILSIDFETKVLFDQRVKIDIPTSFLKLTQEQIDQKYPLASRPSIVFSDEKMKTNIGIGIMKNGQNQDDISKFKRNFTEMIKKNKNLEFKTQSLSIINQKKVGAIEFVSPTITGIDVYNIMFFTDVDGDLLLCTFNCHKSEINEWKEIAYEIQSSLKVN